MPLGEVCLSLGLMTQADVDRVIAALRESRRARFGEVATEMGLLDDDRLARALAQQFRLNMVPAERLTRMQIAADVLGLVPPGLIRDRLLVPASFDVEKKVLTVMVADPTDIPSLRVVQTAAKAARLRLFVAPRGPLRALVERLLPATDLPATTREGLDQLSAPSAHGSTVVYEPDGNRAAALRALEDCEQTGVEIVSDPDQVSAFIEANQADRIFFRRAVAHDVDPYIPAWHRLRPGLQIGQLDGLGPGRQSTVPFGQARDFLLGITEFLLLSRRDAPPEARDRVRRTVRLARELAAELGLASELRDAVTVAALFADLDDLSLSFLDGLNLDGRRFSLPVALLGPFDPPWDLRGLYAALERRVSGEQGPGDNAAMEVLYTARAVARTTIKEGQDPIEALGPEAARHDAATLRALAGVWRKKGLRHLVAAGEGASQSIVLAGADDALITAVADRLARAGFEISIAADGEDALHLARSLQPAAVLAGLRMPRQDGLSLIVALRKSVATRGIPVLLTAEGAQPVDITRALETGADDVIELPTNVDVIVARVRRAIGRRASDHEAISGRLADLPLQELLQTLTLGGRTARVRIQGSIETGMVQVRTGQIVAAQYGSRTGEEAFYEMVALDEGRFEARFVDDGKNNLSRSSDYLLLEALRRRDESRL